MKRQTILSIFIFVLTTTLAGAAYPSEKPNVLFIIIDTLRADHLGCFGYPRNTSPVIDSLVQTGVLFEQAIVQVPRTNPSVASIFTSVYPSRHGVRSTGWVMNEDVPTLAEIFEQEGYRTGAVVANAVLKAKFGFDRGFQQFFHSRKTFNRPAGEVNDIAFRWLEENQEQPFFLWIHYMDPHGPYTPPAPYSELFLEDEYCSDFPGNVEPGAHNYELGRIPKYQWLTEAAVPKSWRTSPDDGGLSKMRRRLHFSNIHGGSPIINDRWYYVAQYDGEIAYNDHMLRAVFEKLDQLGQLDNTLIVLTADHGESLGDHNYYFSHGWFLYDACVHVPLVLSFRGSVPAGVSIPNQVRSIDILPTVLELTGIASPPSISGISLWPLIKSHRRSGLRSLWSRLRGDNLERFDHLPAYNQTNTKNRLRSVRLRRWKLIQQYPYGEGDEELYNLLKDPREERNVLDEYSTARQTLRELLDYWQEGGDLAAQTPEEVDKETEEALRSLGYID